MSSQNRFVGPRPLYHLLDSKEVGAPPLAVSILTGKHGMYMLNAAHAELKHGLDEAGNSFARTCARAERIDVLREVGNSEFARRLAGYSCPRAWAIALATDIKTHGKSEASYFWLAQDLARFGSVSNKTLRDLVFVAHEVYPYHEDAQALENCGIAIVQELIRRARSFNPVSLV